MSNYSDALFEANREIEERKRRYDEAAKAAGELLRAAEIARDWLIECDQHMDAADLSKAIEAFERAGVK